VVAVIAAVRATGAEPLGRLTAATVAAIASRLSSGKRRRTEAAIDQALGRSLAPAQRRQIVRGTFTSFWLDAFALARRGRAVRRLREVPIEGLEKLDEALAGGRGAILWESSGFGSRTLAKQALCARGYTLCQVHADSHLAGFGDYRTLSWFRHRVAKPLFDRWTRSFADEVVDLPRDGGLAFTRVLARRLGNNRVLCIAGDGSMGHGWVSVPFLGARTQFATGTVRLARNAGAPLLPMIGVLDGGPRVVIHEPVVAAADADREAAAVDAVARFAAVVEGWVRRFPEQYRGWPTLHGARFDSSWYSG